MRHPTDDDFVLHYYGESADSDAIERHLRTCHACATAYAQLGLTLESIPALEAPDPGDTFWAELPGRVENGAWWGARSEGTAWPLEAEGAVRRSWMFAALVWLVAALYPYSPAAIFRAGQLVELHVGVGVPVVVLALAWALAGPFVALVALHRIAGGHLSRVRHRLVVYGALAATVSPALFNLTSRTTLGLTSWYLSLAAIAIASLLPLADSMTSSARIRGIHRTSALLILVFAAAHVANHTIAVVNVDAHSALLELLRGVYRQPLVEGVLMGVVGLQVLTGGTLIWKTHLRRPTVAMNVQALSGVYLAVFFLAHVSAALLARPATDTNFEWAAGPRGLLASPGLTFLLPYYLLGVVALFAHVGHVLRARLGKIVSDGSMQRLSYAGMAFAGMVVLTIGLALCGVHVIP